MEDEVEIITGFLKFDHGFIELLILLLIQYMAVLVWVIADWDEGFIIFLLLE